VGAVLSRDLLLYFLFDKHNPPKLGGGKVFTVFSYTFAEQNTLPHRLFFEGWQG